jgi:predicted phosphodiesterase
MRLVATSDTHFDFPPEFVPDGDVFLHCGDLMYTGYPDEWKGRVESLAALPHKLKILVPGNHDVLTEATALRRVLEASHTSGVRLASPRDPAGRPATGRRSRKAMLRTLRARST